MEEKCAVKKQINSQPLQRMENEHALQAEQLKA
jgi:hypothetical protein